MSTSRRVWGRAKLRYKGNQNTAKATYARGLPLRAFQILLPLPCGVLGSINERAIYAFIYPWQRREWRGHGLWAGGVVPAALQMYPFWKWVVDFFLALRLRSCRTGFSAGLRVKSVHERLHNDGRWVTKFEINNHQVNDTCTAMLLDISRFLAVMSTGKIRLRNEHNHHMMVLYRWIAVLPWNILPGLSRHKSTFYYNLMCDSSKHGVRPA